MLRLPQRMDLEQRLRFLTRAYPVSWREHRADELVDTVRDVLGRDKTRLGWSLALNIVLGGWMTRLREHPPLGRWLAYRFLDVGMPPRWRPWVRRDILGRFLVLRRSICTVLPILLIFAVAQVTSGGRLVLPRSLVLGWLIGMPVGSLFLGASFRRRQLLRHGFDPSGEYLAPPAPAWPAFVMESRPRDVRPAWPWLVSGGAAGVLLAIPWQFILVRLAPTLG